MGLFSRKNKTSTHADDTPLFPMVYGGKLYFEGEHQAVINPFDLSVVGRAPKANVEHLNEAVSAARKAYADWSGRSDEERAEACLMIATVFEKNAEELATLITREQGKPLDAGGFGSGFEVGGCIGWSQATSSFKIEDKTLFDADGVTAVQKRVPIGVIGSITPWNWPLLIAVWHFIPALRAGNTVIVKPSPNTPLSTMRAVQLINEILPPGVLNVVPGDAEIGAAISSHPDIDKVVFTGSTATGKRVMASAAQNVTQCTLELGGNDPAIVLPNAPVAAMAQGLFFGSFINAGQTCGAIKRIFVHNDDYEELCDAMSAIASATKVGDGMLADSDMGPVQNKTQFEKVRALTKSAVKSGAKLLTGGERVGRGYALTPAILADCEPGMGIVNEEQFGPAIPLVRYTNVADAVEMANDGPFGLCASVWGSEPEQVQSVSDQLVAGTVYQNTHAELNPMVPFGGVKSSGLGVQFGQEGLHSLTNTKIIYNRIPE